MGSGTEPEHTEGTRQGYPGRVVGARRGGLQAGVARQHAAQRGAVGDELAVVPRVPAERHKLDEPAPRTLPEINIFLFPTLHLHSTLK